MDIESQIQDRIGEKEENSELENTGAVGSARPKRRTKRIEKGKSYIAYVRWTDLSITLKESLVSNGSHRFLNGKC